MVHFLYEEYYHFFYYFKKNVYININMLFKGEYSKLDHF